MSRFPLFLLCALIAGCSAPSGPAAPDLQTLSAAFVDPPASSRPGAFWAWLNGDVTKASITADLEEMKAKGMARAEIWDVEARNNTDGAFGIGPAFLGDESVELIRHALSEGNRLGIRIGMIASSGWNAGGDWVTPDWAAKALYHSELQVSGPVPFSGPLPFPNVPEFAPRDTSGVPLFYKEVAVMAVRERPDRKLVDPSDVVILDEHFDGTTLEWDVPVGSWTVLRYVVSNTGQRLIVPSPNSDGLFIDFFDPKATERHLGHILDRLGITKENAAQAGLGYLEFDSMELDEATPWTDAMDSLFQAHHGYDVHRFLPAFSGWELPEGNDAFLYDFRKTVSDQLILSHYTTGRDFLAQYGVDLVAEAGGPGPPIWDSCPVDALKALGNVSIPRGEFWVRNQYNIFLIKEVASASHIYGLGTVDAESFTTWRRWKDSPHALKPWVDRAFTEGLNAITFHTFANTRPEFGFPGRAYHAGVDFNPTTTWWEQSKPFVDYLSRNSYLLSQGTFVADVAWYYGDKAPNFFPERQGDPESPRIADLGAGYDFDVVNTDVILHRMDTSDGHVTLPGGMQYKLLVLPNREDIPDAVIKKAEELARAGANVLIQNPRIAQEFSGNALRNMTIDEALAQLAIGKDFIGDPQRLAFIHRQIGDTDAYFVRNRTDQPVAETVQFRVTGKSAEFWDPVTSRQLAISSASVANGYTSIGLTLPAYGSGYVVFTDEERELPEYNAPGETQVMELEGPWTLSFPEGWGAPPSVQLDSLISWTDHEDQGIHYFSGTATYSARFTLPGGALEGARAVTLDLGDVKDVAEVFVNGRSAGVLWTLPYALDIAEYVQEGENELSVEVTNQWVNRLTGDMDLEPDKKFTRTNRPPITRSTPGLGDETFRVQESGLLGPVVLRTSKDPGAPSN